MKIRRLSELAQEIPPPHDGWPELEARLQAQHRGTLGSTRRWHPQAIRISVLAAILAAAVLGVSISRWVLAPSPAAPQRAAVHGVGSGERGLPLADITNPPYLHERAALMRSLHARLATLPPPTQRKVLESLAVIRRSIRQIQQALGRQPGNALLQELLIDTYQEQMQVLSSAEEVSGGGTEVGT